MEDSDLSKFCCQNERCVAYGSRGAGNLSVCGRIGKRRDIRLLYCRVCRKRFSERKGTVFYRAHTDPAKVVSILHHVQEGCGMRATGRLLGIKEETVIRYAKLAPAGTPRSCTGGWWPFPPRTREVQLDEKWSFVGKKQRRCDDEDPDDHHRGDCWDHVSYDPEHRLVLGVLCGKRSGSRVVQLVRRTHAQLCGGGGGGRGGRKPLRLFTTDAFPPYATAIELSFGNPVRPRPSGQGKPRPPDPPPPRRNDLCYAIVGKRRDGRGRVVGVREQVVLGTAASLAAALRRSRVSRTVNTSFVERHNATDRHRNARKRRRTYCFSKDWAVHEAVSHFTLYGYNFCCPVRTLRKRLRGQPGRRWVPRTPAMAAGLTDHVWTLVEWLGHPVPFNSS